MIAVVILNYNTYKETINCVESIIEKTTDCKYHIFVVDNCSTDGSYKKLNEYFDGNEKVTLVESKVNLGYSGGNNLICKAIHKEVYEKICIMNSDTILLNNALKKMQDALDTNKDIGIVGPSVLDIDGNESQLLRKNFGFWLYFIYKKPFLFLNGITPKICTEYPYPKSKELYKFEGMVMGCCFMVDTGLFKEMGYFDDNLFLYCEEWILGQKLKDRKLKAGFIKEASIKHLHGVSTGKSGLGFQSYHLYLSALYCFKFYRKMNKIGLFYIYVMNILAYKLKSTKDNSYEALYNKFCKKNKEIFKSKHPVKIN